MLPASRFAGCGEPQLDLTRASYPPPLAVTDGRLCSAALSSSTDAALLDADEPAEAACTLKDAVHNLHPAHGGLPSVNHTMELWERISLPPLIPEATRNQPKRHRGHHHHGKNHTTHPTNATQHAVPAKSTGMTCQEAALHAHDLRPNGTKLELGRTVYRMAKKEAEWEEYQAAVKASIPVARAHLAQLEAAEAKAKASQSKAEAAKTEEVLKAEAAARAEAAKTAEAKATEAAGKQVKAAEHAAEAAARAAHETAAAHV